MLVLGDTKDCNDVSGQRHDQIPLDTWEEDYIFQLLRDAFLPMLVKQPAEYLKPDQGRSWKETLLPEDRNENAPPSTPPPQKTVLFCSFPYQVRHLKWWLLKFFADHLDIFRMYAEIRNDEWTEIQVQFQDWRNPFVFITTPIVGGTGLIHTASNQAVTTQKFCLLDDLWQAFAQGVQLGQNRVPHTW